MTERRTVSHAVIDWFPVGSPKTPGSGRKDKRCGGGSCFACATSHLLIPRRV